MSLDVVVVVVVEWKVEGESTEEEIRERNERGREEHFSPISQDLKRGIDTCVCIGVCVPYPPTPYSLPLTCGPILLEEPQVFSPPRVGRLWVTSSLALQPHLLPFVCLHVQGQFGDPRRYCKRPKEGEIESGKERR